MTQPASEALFDGPGSTASIKWDDHKGQLVLIWAKQEKPFTYDGETKDVIQADVVVLDPPDSAPIKYSNVLVFPRVMQGQIRNNIGRNRPNLGRVAKGEAKPRQTAPWILTDPTEDDKKLAVTYLQKPNAVAAEPSRDSGPAWDGGEPPF